METRTPTKEKSEYKHKLNEAFHNSDFTNMSQNLQLYQLQEAKLQNSRRKRSGQSKENENRETGPTLSHSQIQRLTHEERNELLKNRDFNFELGQEFLESRYVAYQSKDLKYSLKNAKQIEKSLMQLKLDDSDQSTSSLEITKESGSEAKTSKNYPLPSFPTQSKRPLLQASKNKFSNSTNTASGPNSQQNMNDISEFMMDSRFEHDRNDELALVDFSSGSKIKGNREIKSYKSNPRMHMYRSVNSDEVSQIRLENRNRMARRETRNPLMQFFKMILIKFGCSDH